VSEPKTLQVTRSSIQSAAIVKYAFCVAVVLESTELYKVRASVKLKSKETCVRKLTKGILENICCCFARNQICFLKKEEKSKAIPATGHGGL
jgi:hypothetical protein